MIRLMSFIPLAALLALTACGTPLLEPGPDRSSASSTRSGNHDTDQDESLRAGEESVHTVGIITEAPSRRETASFLIEKHPDRPLGPDAGPYTTGDKYHVEVTPQTRIRRRLASGESQPATAADIQVGLRAEVWFVGPIRESYPMQGTAGRIMLFEP